MMMLERESCGFRTMMMKVEIVEAQVFGKNEVESCVTSCGLQHQQHKWIVDGHCVLYVPTTITSWCILVFCGCTKLFQCVVNNRER